MKLDGKEVLTQDTFSYEDVRVGDYVEQAVVDDAMNCLPPVCMTSECAQLGEPYSMRKDPITGKWRNTYQTFKRITRSLFLRRKSGARNQPGICDRRYM